MSPARILVVDDEAALCELLEITLRKMGLVVDCAGTLAAARGRLAREAYALVLTDMRLPDGLGLELVREVCADERHAPVAVITAFGSADNAVEALKAGAFDYVAKPVSLEALRGLVRLALRLSAPSARAAASAASAAGAAERDARLTGDSAPIVALRGQIARLARSMAPVVICGESGSGKELVARAIHARSARAGQAFIAVNCGAIPEALMEAEFFGYRKGAFTGAQDERDGFFQAASGGTLLLDEVAELSLAMQVKLLRAIQERRVRKLGATAEQAVDVRIVSASHASLADCVAAGRFRSDLFYRLNVIELVVPPLRERRDDLPELVEAILARLCAGGGIALGPGVLAALAGYAFPGNVRELENILERALAFAEDGVIEVGDLALKGGRPLAAAPSASPSATGAGTGTGTGTRGAAAASAGVRNQAAAAPTDAPLPRCLPAYLREVERDIIVRALAQTGFNRTRAAQLLGMSFRQLRYQIRRLNIHTPEAP